MSDHRIRTKQNSLDPAEDGGIRSDSQRQTKNAECGKAGSAKQLTKPVAQIPDKVLPERSTARVAALLFYLRKPARVRAWRNSGPHPEACRAQHFPGSALRDAGAVPPSFPFPAYRDEAGPGDALAENRANPRRSCSGLFEHHNARDGGCHPIPVCCLFFELPPAQSCQ
jgi:hypothetical protein